MNTEVVETVTTVAPKAPISDTLMMVIYCAIIFGIIYFLMVRPNKKRMEEYQKMLNSLKVGDRVMAAGIYGNVKKIKDKTIDLEVSKGVIIEVSKNAIAGIEEK